jgi:hypothetical protein
MGLLSLGIVSYASRRAGVETGGYVATLLAVVAGVAEIADVSSQRHVLRIAAPGHEPRREERLRAFQTLRIGLFIVCMAVALGATAAAAPGLGTALNVTFILSATWFFLSNSLYARALAQNQFGVLGFGPLAALSIAGASLLAISRWGAIRPEWALVIALHAAKLGECILLLIHTGFQGAGSSGAAVVREWRDTRFLFFQGTLSAANGRLIIPLASWAAGPPAAAILSIGLSLVSVVSLVSAAVLIPSYRKWLTAGPCTGLDAAFRRARRDWLTAFLVSGVAVVALILASPWFLRRGLGMKSDYFRIGLVYVTVSGIFETINLFAGACYQLCFRDRLLFHLSIVTVCLSWLAVGGGSLLGGIVGLCMAYLAARALGAAALCWPLIAAAVRRPAAVGSHE